MSGAVGARGAGRGQRTGNPGAGPTANRGAKHTGNGPVLAAGCVLWRRSERSGTLEICLVHRPRYGNLRDHKQRSTKPQVRGGSSPECHHA